MKIPSKRCNHEAQPSRVNNNKTKQKKKKKKKNKQKKQKTNATHELFMLGFNDTSTLVGHFVSSTRKREKRDRSDSRGADKGRKEIEEIVDEMKERDRKKRGTGMIVKKQKK